MGDFKTLRSSSPDTNESTLVLVNLAKILFFYVKKWRQTIKNLKNFLQNSTQEGRQRILKLESLGIQIAMQKQEIRASQSNV